MPPRPYLTTLDAVALIVGLVVGVGIFRAPQLVAQNTGSVEGFIGVWVAGGILSLLGALCYAELSTTYPHAGGEYHFIRRAFGTDLAFLFAWSRCSVIQTGSIAILCYVFADYLAPVPEAGKLSHAGRRGCSGADRIESGWTPARQADPALAYHGGAHRAGRGHHRGAGPARWGGELCRHYPGHLSGPGGARISYGLRPSHLRRLE